MIKTLMVYAPLIWPLIQLRGVPSVFIPKFFLATRIAHNSSSYLLLVIYSSALNICYIVTTSVSWLQRLLLLLEYLSFARSSRIPECRFCVVFSIWRFEFFRFPSLTSMVCPLHVRR